MEGMLLGEGMDLSYMNSLSLRKISWGEVVYWMVKKHENENFHCLYLHVFKLFESK
jgi:hypothetical protein